LRINDCFPEFLSLDSFPSFTLLFIRCVELLKFFAVALVESFGLIRAKESPVLIISNSLHEEIWNPQSIEKVSGSLLLFTMIFLQLQEVKDIGMPGL